MSNEFTFLDKNPLPPLPGKVDVMLADGTVVPGCEVVVNPRTVGQRDSYDVVHDGQILKRLYVNSGVQSDPEYARAFGSPRLPITAWRKHK
jgi:hypothetical protein